MRQRNLKHKEEINKENEKYILKDPISKKGQWKTFFADPSKNLYIEIGSGKGAFILEMAKRNPDNNYLACEGAVNIAPRILQKLEGTPLDNVMLIMDYIIDPFECFEYGELDGVYLNFSDPWPKDRHAHRRLTHVNKLLSYRKIMKNGSTLEFKTDNDDLFEFSLEQLKLAELTPSIVTRDLHNSIYNKDNVPTEYEDKFSSQGKNINYFKVIF